MVLGGRRFRAFFKKACALMQKSLQRIYPYRICLLLSAGRLFVLARTREKAPLFITMDEEALILAVARQSLPTKIGVDWSHGGCGTYCSMHDTVCDTELGEAFVDIVKRMESLVCYEKILSSALRVCSKGNPGAPPSAWPEFLSTPLEEVHFLQPDFYGNVRL